jgi:hypothetical protein
MSPRAAWQLEGMGFHHVYDYEGGKLDWLAHALPVKGKGPHYAVAGDVVEDDVVACGVGSDLAAIRIALEMSGASYCVILNRQDVVLGRVRSKRLTEASELREVVEPGPATVQLCEPLGPLTERMKVAKVDSIIVTSPKGQLLGVVRRRNAERFLESTKCSELGRHPRR